MSILEYEPPSSEEISEEIGDLMKGANKKMEWARKMALKFLAVANDLEDRAHMYRRLAANMAMEAQAFNHEIEELIIAEFPMDLSDDDEEEECDGE